MYRKKDKSKQTQMQMVCMEDLVPQEHLLREIESAMDWTFIYDEVKGLYKEAKWGIPASTPWCCSKSCLSNICTASGVCGRQSEK